MKVWGAGGAGRVGNWDNWSGGAGGFTEAVVDLPPGTELNVIVGSGGKYGTDDGGNGGWPYGGHGT